MSITTHLTNKEAIEILKNRMLSMSMCSNSQYCIDNNAALHMAIDALSEKADKEKSE